MSYSSTLRRLKNITIAPRSPRNIQVSTFSHQAEIVNQIKVVENHTSILQLWFPNSTNLAQAVHDIKYEALGNWKGLVGPFRHLLKLHDDNFHSTIQITFEFFCLFKSSMLVFQRKLCSSSWSFAEFRWPVPSLVLLRLPVLQIWRRSIHLLQSSKWSAWLPNYQVW